MRRPTSIIVAVAVAVLLAACAAGTNEPSAPAPAPAPAAPAQPPAAPEPPPAPPVTITGSVVIDTDLSTDDLMAIAMLVGSPDVDVAAITVTGAFVRCPRGQDVVLGLLASLGVSGIPVACGTTEALAGGRAFPSQWRDLADGAWGVPLAPATEAPYAGGGVALLREALSQGASTLVVLGPHTNVAQLLRDSPELAERIDVLLMMGGAVDVAGNVYTEGPQPPVAEWNVYVDPVAAAEVFAAGIPIVMVGLDATNAVPVTSAFVERLRREGSGTAVDLMAGMLERNRLTDAFDSYFWDQLAVAFLLDPEVVRLEEIGITVVTDGAESGRTVRDPAAPTVSVALGADPSLLETLMIEALSGR